MIGKEHIYTSSETLNDYYSQVTDEFLGFILSRANLKKFSDSHKMGKTVIREKVEESQSAIVSQSLVIMTLEEYKILVEKIFNDARAAIHLDGTFDMSDDLEYIVDCEPKYKTAKNYINGKSEIKD